MEKPMSRYQMLGKYMSIALIADGLFFLIYFIAAACSVIWLKVTVAIIAILLSVLCLAYLYITRELTKPRSLWMTAGAGAVLILTVFSLIVNFP